MSAGVPIPLLPRPSWIRARAPQGPEYERLKGLMRGLELHTVCEEAHCPNLGECWSRGTATFMILGEVCTRACGFCAVKTGLPGAPPDTDEPRRVADAVARMGLRHAVVTSVNRDDLGDGGAAHFAETIRAIRRRVPGCTVEVLVPDFCGNWEALGLVLREVPEILNHNLESVARLYHRVRPQALYERSLELIARADRFRRENGSVMRTKSGVMAGLGETMDELREALRDLKAAGCDVATVGQYLQPHEKRLPVERYYTPEEFEAIRREGEAMGFQRVESGPLVRSSYHARRALEGVSA